MENKILINFENSKDGFLFNQKEYGTFNPPGIQETFGLEGQVFAYGNLELDTTGSIKFNKKLNPGFHIAYDIHDNQILVHLLENGQGIACYLKDESPEDIEYVLNFKGY